jgi:hypothetical protein
MIRCHFSLTIHVPTTWIWSRFQGASPSYKDVLAFNRSGEVLTLAGTLDIIYTA